MKAKSKSEPDYVAEIDLPCAKLIGTFSKILKKEYRIETEKVDDSTNHFLSKDLKHSFRKSVIKAVPAKIEWCVTELSPMRCRISVFFHLPTWLKIRFYLIFTFINCLFSGGCFVLFHHTELRIWNLNDSVFMGFLRVTLIGLSVAFFFFTYLYLRLLGRYPEFIKVLLPNVCQINSERVGNASLTSIPVEGGQFIDWKIFIFALSTFGCVPITYVDEKVIMSLITPGISLLIPLFGITIALFSFFLFRVKQRYSLFMKAGTVVLNYAIGLFFVLLLLEVPTTMYKEAKEVARILNVPTINDSYFASQLGQTFSSSDITTAAPILNSVNAQCVKMVLEVLGIWFLAVTALIICSIELAYLSYQGSVTQDKELKQRFLIEEASAKTDRISLRLPLIIKIMIILNYFVFSACCWAGVLINLSLLNALIAPNLQLIPITYGEIIAEGTILMASAVFGRPQEDTTVRILRLFLVIPAILPFVLLVFLNLRIGILKHLKTRSFIPITGNVATQISNIAAKFGIPNISCLLDMRSSRISPYAVVIGWYPRRMIVFTERGLAFLTEHHEHAEAIIAHEIAHLKRDCLRIWKLRLLSRLGLVGVGFLSVLHDSIAIEDHADDAARRFLRENGKDDNLVVEAASMLEAQDYFDNKFPGQNRKIVTAFSTSYNSIHTEQIRQSFMKRLVRGLRISHYFYFSIELYDYIHREAKYRRLQTVRKGI